MSTILRLAWTETNDWFDVISIESEFALWFVEQCQNHESSFVYDSGSLNIFDLVKELKSNIHEVNDILLKLKFAEIPMFDDLYDQHNLNLTHKNWISVVRREPRIDKLFFHINPACFQKFHNINLLVHKIESGFNYRFLGQPPWRTLNKFENHMPDNLICTVAINYTDWGKSSWHKFVDGDTIPNDFELSNWKTIGSDMSINLCRPYEYEYPKDYLDYCDQNHISPAVNKWPLGNLSDYNNDLSRVRQLMDKNVQIKNNFLRFSIVE
jgi:hypothetical protein